MAPRPPTVDPVVSDGAIGARPGPGSIVPGSGLDPVDLLDLVLADVRDPQVAVVPVEREPPRVAQPCRPDLVTCVELVVADEGVVGGNRRIDRRVQSEHLAEQRGGVLRTTAGVAARPAVAQADVEHAVGTELDVTAVVVRERLFDVQQVASAVGVGPPRPSASARVNSSTWLAPLRAAV